MPQEPKIDIAFAENKTLFRCSPNKVLRFYYLVLENYYSIPVMSNVNYYFSSN